MEPGGRTLVGILVMGEWAATYLQNGVINLMDSRPLFLSVPVPLPLCLPPPLSLYCLSFRLLSCSLLTVSSVIFQFVCRSIFMSESAKTVHENYK